jgi:hypothetical protein
MSETNTYLQYGASSTPPDSGVRDVDDALRQEDVARQSERQRDAQSGQLLRRIFAVPELLRSLGSGVLCAAALVFMVQNWGSADDVVRTFYFLGFTATLAAAGFFCGVRMREDKGARTFLALAAAMVPALFTVLGALLYSQFPWLSGFAEYPDYAVITAPSALAAVSTTLVVVAALVPITWLSFLTLARPEVRRLSALYLLANAALLVPTRHPDVIGVLALSLFAALVWIDRRVWHPIAALRTREGHLVRAMLAIPPLVLIGRSLHLYAFSSLFGAGLLGVLAGVLFEAFPQLTASRDLARAAQRAAALAAIGAFACAADAAVNALGLGQAAVLPLTCIPAAATLVFASLRAVDDGIFHRRLAALVAVGGTGFNLVVHPGVGASFFSLATGVAATAYGWVAEQKVLLVAGAAAVAWSVLYHLHLALEVVSVSPWLSLAVVGVATVLAASLLERHGHSLAHRVGAFRDRVAAWEA